MPKVDLVEHFIKLIQKKDSLCIEIQKIIPFLCTPPN